MFKQSLQQEVPVTIPACVPLSCVCGLFQGFSCSLPGFSPCFLCCICYLVCSHGHLLAPPPPPPYISLFSQSLFENSCMSVVVQFWAFPCFPVVEFLPISWISHSCLAPRICMFVSDGRSEPFQSFDSIKSIAKWFSFEALKTPHARDTCWPKLYKCNKNLGQNIH